MHCGIRWAEKDPPDPSFISRGKSSMHFLAAIGGVFEFGQLLVHSRDVIYLQKMRPLNLDTVFLYLRTVCTFFFIKTLKIPPQKNLKIRLRPNTDELSWSGGQIKGNLWNHSWMCSGHFNLVRLNAQFDVMPDMHSFKEWGFQLFVFLFFSAGASVGGRLQRSAHPGCDGADDSRWPEELPAESEARLWGRSFMFIFLRQGKQREKSPEKPEMIK